MGKTIAWIEDDTDIIDPVVRPLELAGYHVRRYRTASEALDAGAEIAAADLILLDMIQRPGQLDVPMGRYPGIEVLSRLQNSYHLTQPIIVLTVVRNEELAPELERLGVHTIVHKPVLPSRLKAHVESALNE
jgi:DNA-binding response OmpR family regulator